MIKPSDKLQIQRVHRFVCPRLQKAFNNVVDSRGTVAMNCTGRKFIRVDRYGKYDKSMRQIRATSNNIQVKNRQGHDRQLLGHLEVCNISSNFKATSTALAMILIGRHGQRVEPTSNVRLFNIHHAARIPILSAPLGQGIWAFSTANPVPSFPHMYLTISKTLFSLQVRFLHQLIV